MTQRQADETPDDGAARTPEPRRWSVRTSDAFDREFRRLDRAIQRRVLIYLAGLEDLEDPRVRGKALTGPRSGTWRYRVGNYRVLASIEDDTVTILALSVGHRSTVYDD